MDDSNDNTYAAHVSVFVRAIKDNIDAIEELLGLESLHYTNKGSDLLETLKNHSEEKCDESLAIWVSKSVCLTLLEQFTGRPILKHHYIIHQKALCRKILNEICQDVVVQCVKRKFRSSSLNWREFRQLLSDINEKWWNDGYIGKFNGFQN
ncbi:hypothetical protein RF11_13099 [Thelohanellus kitauei]|uniref:DUF4371 domain-containing protein n=1 Tax=Thelohanellus kitauei TaxID=669202 RepID=A0A0C2IK70_THEKT|nr:hypothetical protein RF11_13099 [Thelohanellus kitauei]